MADPWSDLMDYHKRLDAGGPKLPSVSPLIYDGEGFAYAMYQQKRDQVELWKEENGADVPGWLQDACSEWRLKWLAKFYEELRQ